MEIIVLRLVHIVCGTVWAGSAVFSTVLLVPALAKLGPAGAPVMAGLRERGLFVFMPTMALLTILSGTRLMGIVSSGFDASWFNSVRGSTYAWSGVAAIVAFVLGLAISWPLGGRIRTLAGEVARAPDDATRTAIARRMAPLQKWMSALDALVTTLLVISAAGMSMARYLS